MSVGTGDSVGTGVGGTGVSVGTGGSVGTGVGDTDVLVGTGGAVGIDVASPTPRRDSALGAARTPDGVAIPSAPQAERRGMKIRIEIREVSL